MIIGHQKQWNFLIKSVKENRVSHAYLFFGPSHIGKKKVAIEFAKYLNCLNRDNNQPCNQCEICYQIEKKIWPNLIFLEPEASKSVIPIEKIRELKEKLALSTQKNLWKVAIIDEAHKLSFDAQSALLKQLEEPKGNVVIILVSEYPYKILPTIVSRCQKIQFEPVQEGLVSGMILQLENLKDINIEFLNKKVGLILNAAADQNILEETRKRIQEINQLKNQSMYVKFKYAKEIAKNENIEKILEIWLAYFRDLMYKELIGQNKDHIWTKDQLQRILTNLQEIYYLITNSNVNPELALELLFLEL
ncbi:AAA family ATPase [bacterium]|nr:AAA family ATPase [bacterium]